MARPYYVIDAFTSQRFTGNAAAVVLDAGDLGDDQMQAIAAEFNLSETTFVLPPSQTCSTDQPAAVPARDRSVRFRWFTPATEVAICGHATVAGVHALVSAGRLPWSDRTESAELDIETRSGWLRAFVERIPGREGERMIWLDLPDPTLEPHPLTTAKLARLLNLAEDALASAPPIARTQDHDLLVFVQSVGALNEARPDFAKLGEVLRRDRLRGLCLATVQTLTPSVHVQSRFFAPTAGIDEDPVTGSVHGPLAACLVRHGVVPVRDGTAALTCVQGRAGGRAGLLHALVRPRGQERFAVRIGGRAVTTMQGTLYV